jgi:hypothetical protein
MPEEMAIDLNFYFDLATSARFNRRWAEGVRDSGPMGAGASRPAGADQLFLS